ncbi:SMC family ATPase, partial [Mammaliicoccus fleurettii]|nr:SMC family ATPase [Mammaliicoccus fleurettii]
SIESNTTNLNEINERIEQLNRNSERINEFRQFVQNTNHIKLSLNKYIEAEIKFPNIIEEQKNLNKLIDKDKHEIETLKSKLESTHYDESVEQDKIKEQETLKLNLQELQTKQKQYSEKLELLDKQKEYTSQLTHLEKEKTQFEVKLNEKSQFDILNVEDEILKIQKHVHQGDDCPICGSIIESINGNVDFNSLKKEREQQLEVERNLHAINNK